MTPLSLERENYLNSRLQIWYAALYGEYRAGAQIIFPESGCGVGQVTLIIFGIRPSMSLLYGITVGYPSDSLAFCIQIIILRPICTNICACVQQETTTNFQVDSTYFSGRLKAHESNIININSSGKEKSSLHT